MLKFTSPERETRAHTLVLRGRRPFSFLVWNVQLADINKNRQEQVVCLYMEGPRVPLPSHASERALTQTRCVLCRVPCPPGPVVRARMCEAWDPQTSDSMLGMRRYSRGRLPPALEALGAVT